MERELNQKQIQRQSQSQKLSLFPFLALAHFNRALKIKGEKWPTTTTMSATATAAGSSCRHFGVAAVWMSRNITLWDLSHLPTSISRRWRFPFVNYWNCAVSAIDLPNRRNGRRKRRVKRSGSNNQSE